MWNPDNKKELLSPKVHEPRPTLQLMDEFLVFKYNFLNSTNIRKVYGFEKRQDGKLYMVDRKWADTTQDLIRKDWVRQIFKEHYGGIDVAKKDQEVEVQRHKDEEPRL